ncbi:MAG: complex I NDUFA9 subunit family protein [Pacificimonas sp.]|jgi:NADH dehydrogenase|nr:complex I NDUFA9 subunit family protein [Pacificimonas sp.]
MAKLVTVFGAAGFIGRYVCQELAKSGARVRAVTRDPHSALFLKPLANLGQLATLRGSLADPAPLSEGADAVINLVGVLDEGKQSFQAVHVDGARRAAEAAAVAGASAFVQVSAIGADPEAKAAYARSKGEGEAAVREAFPGATILRPSIVFGPEDDFLNRFAKLIRMAPVMPIISGDSRFQPVYVADLAEAVAAAALDPVTHGGETYEVGGPDEVTMRELMNWIKRTIGSDTPLIDTPDNMVAWVTKRFGWLPFSPMNWDQWLMLQEPNVVTGANGLAAFDIAPTPMQAVAPNWMVHYRRHGRFTEIKA